MSFSEDFKQFLTNCNGLAFMADHFPALNTPISIRMPHISCVMRDKCMQMQMQACAMHTHIYVCTRMYVPTSFVPTPTVVSLNIFLTQNLHRLAFSTNPKKERIELRDTGRTETEQIQQQYL